jgi:hypothetical protein
MNINSVLTQLPKAQEAYTASLAQWGDLNTDVQLLEANTAIHAAIAKGHLNTHINGIENVCVAEKVAIELGELGYNTACVSGGHAPQPDGSMRQVHAVTIGWKWLPHNSRDAYTV